MKKSKTTTIQCKAVTGPPTGLRCGYFGAAAALMLLMTAGTAWGQPSEVTKLLASDAAAEDEFGFSVSISGDTAVVGAPFHDHLAGSNSGSAYIVQQDPADPDTWNEIKELIALDAFTGDHFGTSVSISGDFAIVGARLDDDDGSNSGSAYIFYRDQNGTDEWGQVAKITASDAAAGDRFGTSVSMSGGLAVIGATGVGSAVGAAYIFERDGAGVWNEVAILTASDGVANDVFGISVSISGYTALVGAWAHPDNGILSGAAYVFQQDHGGTDIWGEVEKLTPSDGAAFDFFGGSVAISIDTAVVGAFGDNSAAGSAYIFERDAGGADQWDQTAKLTAFDPANNDQFGVSVSIRGEGVVVGANGDDDDGFESGSAYLFREPSSGGWVNATENEKITASDAAAGDEFAFFVSISGDRAILGAHFNDDDGTNSGSAYIFDGVCPCPWDLDANGGVGVADLLILLANWGNPYGVPDLLDLLLNWGLCPCGVGPEPLTLEEELADACLSQADWDEFVEVMGDPNRSQEDKDRYECWMTHYLFHCDKCTCIDEPDCPSPDPFG